MFSRKIRLILAVGIIAALFAIIVPAVLAAPPSAPQIGQWEAIDEDGSNVELTVTPGPHGTYRVIWRDDYWTLCDGDPGIGLGTATLDSGDANVLNADMSFYCGGTLALAVTVPFTYDPGTDTLTHNITGTPVTWYRR